MLNISFQWWRLIKHKEISAARYCISDWTSCKVFLHHNRMDCWTKSYLRLDFPQIKNQEPKACIRFQDLTLISIFVPCFSVCWTLQISKIHDSQLLVFCEGQAAMAPVGHQRETESWHSVISGNRLQLWLAYLRAAYRLPKRLDLISLCRVLHWD